VTSDVIDSNLTIAILLLSPTTAVNRSSVDSELRDCTLFIVVTCDNSLVHYGVTELHRFIKEKKQKSE